MPAFIPKHILLWVIVIWTNLDHLCLELESPSTPREPHCFGKSINDFLPESKQRKSTTYRFKKCSFNLFTILSTTNGFDHLYNSPPTGVLWREL